MTDLVKAVEDSRMRPVLITVRRGLYLDPVWTNFQAAMWCSWS